MVVVVLLGLWSFMCMCEGLQQFPNFTASFPILSLHVAQSPGKVVAVWHVQYTTSYFSVFEKSLRRWSVPAQIAKCNFPRVAYNDINNIFVVACVRDKIQIYLSNFRNQSYQWTNQSEITIYDTTSAPPLDVDTEDGFISVISSHNDHIHHFFYNFLDRTWGVASANRIKGSFGSVLVSQELIIGVSMGPNITIYCGDKGNDWVNLDTSLCKFMSAFPITFSLRPFLFRVNATIVDVYFVADSRKLMYMQISSIGNITKPLEIIFSSNATEPIVDLQGASNGTHALVAFTVSMARSSIIYMMMPSISTSTAILVQRVPSSSSVSCAVSRFDSDFLLCYSTNSSMSSTCLTLGSPSTISPSTSSVPLFNCIGYSTQNCTVQRFWNATMDTIIYSPFVANMTISQLQGSVVTVNEYTVFSDCAFILSGASSIVSNATIVFKNSVVLLAEGTELLQLRGCILMDNVTLILSSGDIFEVNIANCTEVGAILDLHSCNTGLVLEKGEKGLSLFLSHGDCSQSNGSLLAGLCGGIIGMAIVVGLTVFLVKHIIREMALRRLEMTKMTREL